MGSVLTSQVARRALRPIISELDRRIERGVRRGSAGEARELRARVDALSAELAEARRELDEARVPRYALELLLGKEGGRPASRLPTKGLIDTLSGEVAATTGAKDARAQVVAAYRTLVEVEMRGVGRMAGGTANILGKLTATPLLGPPNAEVLEIGTLFGLFSGALARQLSRFGLTCSLTIVDPLADVQLQPGTRNGRDPSGSPVSEQVLRANLALAGVDPERVRVRPGFSGDPEVRDAVSDRSYGVVVVDGDHSAEGVADDLAWVEEIVAPGGIVVVDDYGDRNWPGVKEAADRHLADSDLLELVGVCSTSAFLRARGA
ncbi:hypothetical protein AQ490_17300 [Wenjunlia vitaminophila]|uniref:Class I SAM-dependent methyltransferase n=1 Tax=Wenjunlia vitaminophila TaxID=76728 RepID=A0A0T6LVS7_WENVI|nr:class I SAM-dependent methyltransferase [Wenjunlia vitaminophila]KRV50157.1 hypothetical protein AQ490_17300 [Wenjunlia vitaminophila]